MNFTYFIVLCLVLVLVVPDSDGFFWRRRRRRRHPAPTPPCRQICTPYGCQHWCRYVNGQVRCGFHCGGNRCYSSCGKRDEAEEQMVKQDEAEEQVEQVQSDVANSPSSDVYSYRFPLTNKFTDYDKNKDGRISYSEFKKTMPPVSEEKQIKTGFDVFDKNGDRHIDCKEFLRANVDFGNKKPTCK